MKENRFIELLNLYVDHQIGAEEAAELEAEILRSPERRKMYRDYCRMQKACGLLFDRESQEAPASSVLEQALRETERKIIDFPTRRRVPRGTYTAAFAGIAAMAACVAVVLMRPAATPVATGGGSVAMATPAVKTSSLFAAQAPAPLVQTVALAPRVDFQPVLTADNFTTGRDEVAATTDRSGTEWMQQVQLPPVQRVLVDASVFEAKPTLQQDNRVFRGSRPLQGSVELTAFQFQR